MKKTIIEKKFAGVGMTYHNAGGVHTVTPQRLKWWIGHCLKAGRAMSDVYNVVDFKETEDGKAWEVIYETENEYWKRFFKKA